MQQEETPVPIPNTEVKLLLVDDTALLSEWESKLMPPLLYANNLDCIYIYRSLTKS